jgi:predicted tellurium resistance membrane protein TerC
MLHALIGLFALTAMEIVLGIDNIVFISLAVARLPPEKQPLARRIGLGLALVVRLILLAFASWLVHMEQPIFRLSAIGITQEWLEHWSVDPVTARHIIHVSVKDLVLLIGGLFLIKSAVREIHDNVEGTGHDVEPVRASLSSVITQIVFLDMIFSLDSIITAVGMSRELWVMMLAVAIAMGIMLFFAKTVGDFVSQHPTVKMLALSFLLLIGTMLFIEGVGAHVDKGYIYFAMAFALGVEILNLRMRSKRIKREHLQTP